MLLKGWTNDRSMENVCLVAISNDRQDLSKVSTSKHRYAPKRELISRTSLKDRSTASKLIRNVRKKCSDSMVHHTIHTKAVSIVQIVVDVLINVGTNRGEGECLIDCPDFAFKIVVIHHQVPQLLRKIWESCKIDSSIQTALRFERTSHSIAVLTMENKYI